MNTQLILQLYQDSFVSHDTYPAGCDGHPQKEYSFEVYAFVSKVLANVDILKECIDPINKPFRLDPKIIAYLAEKAAAHRQLYDSGWGAPFDLIKKKKSNDISTNNE